MLLNSISIFTCLLVAIGEINSYLHHINTNSSQHAPVELQSDASFSNGNPVRSMKFESSRRKRQVERQNNDQIYTIEVVVAFDRTLERFHNQENLKEYILSLMLGASHIYVDPSIGNQINLSVKEIVHLKDMNVETMSPDENGKDVDDYLQKFCKHMKKREQESGQTFDAAVLLTKHTLCEKYANGISCLTKGRAYTKSICVNPCAIVQDTGLSTSFTIAHELGHILGAPHDRVEPYGIMGRVVHPESWSWSANSRLHMTNFLRDEKAKCLLHTTSVNMLSRFSMNETYLSLEYQCKLTFGSKVYDIAETAKIFSCSNIIRCFKYEKRGDTTEEDYINYPWANGSKCGEGRWCQRGQCVGKTDTTHFSKTGEKHLKPIIIDGRWGRWKKGGECSETCGKGWQLFSRECNYPEPQNGGKRCEGNSQEYRQCDNRSCNVFIPKFEWKIRWTECIHGAAYKIVECANDKNQVVQHSYCSYLKPNNNNDIRSCSNGQYDFNWKVKSKSPCSVECGYGHRHVFYNCMQRFLDSNDSRDVSDEYCKHINGRKAKEECYVECDSPTWIYGEYGACIGTCDNGIQTRTVYCYSNGTIVDNQKCAHLHRSDLYRNCKRCDGTEAENHENKDKPDEEAMLPGKIVWIVCIMVVIIAFIAAVIYYFYYKKPQLNASQNQNIYAEKTACRSDVECMECWPCASTCFLEGEHVEIGSIQDRRKP